MANRSSHRRDRPRALLLVVLLAAAAASVSRADIEADKKECMDQLLQLQPCLPYVSKEAVKPNSDCCASVTQILSKSLRCLCILIKDRDDPLVKSFNIDLDRAFTVPGVCGLNASLSDCPKLLNLAPGSPDAQIFKDVDGRLHGNSSTGGSNPGSATASSNPGNRTTGGEGLGAAPPGCLGGGLWVYANAAALLLVAVLNVHDA